MHNKKLHMVAFVLLAVGGLNWLLYAFGYNIVNMVFGTLPVLEDAVYVLVGLAAIYEIATHRSHCTQCSASSSEKVTGGNVVH